MSTAVARFSLAALCCLLSLPLLHAGNDAASFPSYAAPSVTGAIFLETFQATPFDNAWTPAHDPKYTARLTSDSSPHPGIPGDRGGRVQKGGPCAVVVPLAGKWVAGRTTVVQFEITLSEKRTCSRTNIHLVAAPFKELEKWTAEAPYSLMVAVDTCGARNTVRFGMQTRDLASGKNVEHYMDVVVSGSEAAGTLLHTLVVEPDGGFEIHVDGEVKAQGTIQKDLTPPVLSTFDRKKVSAVLPVSGVTIEATAEQDGVVLDNILVIDELEKAKSFARDTFWIKKRAELAASARRPDVKGQHTAGWFGAVLDIAEKVLDAAEGVLIPLERALDRAGVLKGIENVADIGIAKPLIVSTLVPLMIILGMLAMLGITPKKRKELAVVHTSVDGNSELTPVTNVAFGAPLRAAREALEGAGAAGASGADGLQRRAGNQQ